jgi:WD40 repeat protein
MGKTIKNPACTILLLTMIISGCSKSEIVLVDTAVPTGFQVASQNTMSVTPLTNSIPPVVPETPTSRSTEKPAPTIEPTVTRENVPECSGEGIPIFPPDGFGLPGSLVLKYQSRQELLTIGGTPLEQSILTLPEIHQIQALSFSPDEEWLAYTPVTRESNFAKVPISKTMVVSGTEIILETPSIVLLSASGERIERIVDVRSVEKDLVEGDYLQRVIALSWINDHLLNVIFRTNNFDPYSSGHYLDEIFDPFEGVWLDEPFEEIEDRSPDGELAFSPDMSRVLYEVGTENHASGIALRDLENDTVIWSDREFYSPHQTFISWSPDSSMVAVGNWGVSSEDRLVYLISRDGEARKIVDSLCPAPDFMVEKLSWSPDGHYLAIKNGIAVIDKLYLFDTVTKQYLYSCPLVSYPNGNPVWVWSPDGRYLALSSFLSSDKFPLQVMDVQTGQVIEILPDGNLKVYLEDWLDTFPLEWP